MSDTTQTPTADLPTDASTAQPTTEHTAPTEHTAAPTVPAPENPYAAARPEPAPGQAAAASNGFSVASLVLGLVSIPTGGFVAGVIAIVFGFVARSREPQARTMSTWGIVLGFVGIFGWAILALLGLLVAAPFALWGMSFANGHIGLF